MSVEKRYTLDKLDGMDTWYLWQGDREYVIHTGTDPVALVRKLFEVPDPEPFNMVRNVNDLLRDIAGGPDVY